MWPNKQNIQQKIILLYCMCTVLVQWCADTKKADNICSDHTKHETWCVYTVINIVHIITVRLFHLLLAWASCCLFFIITSGTSTATRPFLCLLSSFSTESSMEVAFHEAAMEWHYSNSEWNSQTSGFWLLGVCKRYRGTPIKGTSMLYNWNNVLQVPNQGQEFTLHTAFPPAPCLDLLSHTNELFGW